eukprot:9487864-Pyramimonas_sp.AAC.1
MSVRVPPLDHLFGPSWRPLGESWRPPDLLWGHIGGFLSRFVVTLEASWALLERQEAEKARTPK